MALGDSEATLVYIAAKITAEYAPLVEAVPMLLEETEAVLRGDLGQDWADHHAPLFNQIGVVRSALRKVVSDE